MIPTAVILGDDQVRRILGCSCEAERYCVVRDILGPINPEFVAVEYRKAGDRHYLRLRERAA